MESRLFLSGQRALLWLKAHGYNTVDDVEPQVSPYRFATGGAYGVEVPVVNNLATLRKTIHLLREEGVYVTRFNETHGAFLLCDSEIREMLALCAQEGYGIAFGLGPRPEYDRRAAFYRSEFGMEQARQINNHDALRASVTDALRLASLGCRGLIVYDLGVLRVLNAMRAEGELPHDMIFKVSSHCMVSNSMLAEIHAENGANSLTVSHDVGLPMLQAMRRAAPAASLDVPLDVYRNKGGFIRFHEVAEIVQVAAPVFLKIGSSSQTDPYDNTNETTIAKRVNRVKRALEMLDENLPMAQRIGSQDPLVCLPVLESVTTLHTGVDNHLNHSNKTLATVREVI